MMNVLSTNTPVVVNSGPFDDHAILDEARIRKELMHGAIVDVDPLDEAIVDVTPMDETVTHEPPVEANVGSLRLSRTFRDGLIFARYNPEK
jgi:hypothetical protein